jgi:hypothetical protein
MLQLYFDFQESFSPATFDALRYVYIFLIQLLFYFRLGKTEPGPTVRLCNPYNKKFINIFPLQLIK